MTRRRSFWWNRAGNRLLKYLVRERILEESASAGLAHDAPVEEFVERVADRSFVPTADIAKRVVRESRTDERGDLAAVRASSESCPIRAATSASRLAGGALRSPCRRSSMNCVRKSGLPAETASRLAGSRSGISRKAPVSSWTSSIDKVLSERLCAQAVARASLRSRWSGCGRGVSSSR
jgi:hypothetical protein